jgi:hypothetical protein
MSTPERPQDPGEHGYGGTNQEYPVGDDTEESEEPTEDTDGADDPRESPAPDEPEHTA